MLASKIEFGRDRIYDLLFEIANGFAPLTMICHTSDEGNMPLKDACVREVKRGIDIFLADMNSPNPQVQKKAKELFELLNDNA
jgi:hypothetical protein